MRKTALLFSGQGSQKPGMGVELAERSAAAREVFACGSDILRMDLLKVCREGSAEELAKTEVAQPGIFAVSLAGYYALKEETGFVPDAVAGHSLGEYGALAAAGVFSLEDGFRLIRARALAMQKAAENTNGSMAAVSTSDEEILKKVCGGTVGRVWPVNFNSPKQTVIAGEKSAMMAACARFTEMKIRIIPLAVAGAFHTPLMQEAADEFAQTASSISFHAPTIPFYSNVTGARLEAVDVDYLKKHMVSAVLFTKEIRTLQEAGIGRYIEVGPGRVLSGLVKKTLEEAIAYKAETYKAETPAELDALTALFQLE